MIDNIFITVISYKRHDKSVSRLCAAVIAPNQAMLEEQLTSLPVDDAFAVEEEESDCYLCCIKPAGRKKKGWVPVVSLLVALSFEKLAKVFSEKR